ncbi:hypothetical protein V6N13_034141 [Hibiscus sabdariffa]
MAAPSATSLVLFLVSFSLPSVFGDYGGGLEGGHATFYGGGDASGTMEGELRHPDPVSIETINSDSSE